MPNKKSAKMPKRPAGNLPETQARVQRARIERSGKSTRAKGHLSASTRRNQAKRDSVNS